MTYRQRSDLNIIELKDGEEDISFDRLEKAILSRPSSIIYCERNKKLHGIITMGDIDRASEAGRGVVTVNTGFGSLLDGEYMKAREIFRDRENIHAIPILDEDGKLTGDWSRWNDRLKIEHMFDWGGTILPPMTRWHLYCLVAHPQTCATGCACMAKSWLQAAWMSGKLLMTRFANILTG